MRHISRLLAVTVLGWLILPCPAPACSLCAGDLRSRLTLREEAQGDAAKLILYGTLENPRLTAAGNGITDLKIDTVVRPHAALGDRKVVQIPRYLPANDPKDPPKYLIFCDVLGDKLDMYRGVPVQSAVAVTYLKGALALGTKDRTKTLLYCFAYLEHADKEIAADAYLEFAKANDQEIGQLAGKLSADRLRAWLQDPRTPSERLGLYAFLLGACGGRRDGELLRSLLQNPGERILPAFDGLLGGYIQLQPVEGWDLALETLRDEKKPFAVRFAVLRTLRFYHGWKPEESRVKVLRGLGALLPQGDLADLAIEDLRRWQLWDLTREVLDQYGKKTHDSPLVRQTIVRYALCCPRTEAQRFVAEQQRQEPDLVKEVEESLQYEKK